MSVADDRRAGTGQVPAPRLEGAITLADGRRIGYAEYGDPAGRVVIWFHGTPGARRQMPVASREAATRRGVRLVVLERPGIGLSTTHPYDRVVDWAVDVDECADRLGVERFAVAGLSGGGPYALASAHELPDRVVAGAVLGGVAPTRGVEGITGGLVQLATWTRDLLRPLRSPLGRGLWLGLQAGRPFSSAIFDAYARLSPPGDRQVFSEPGMKEMFVDDLLRGGRTQFAAFVHDVVLFTRHWGFEVGGIDVPFHFWHGDADTVVPLEHGEHLAGLLPGAELRVRPGESHLGGLAAASEVLDALLGHWDEGAPAARGGRGAPGPVGTSA
jgi:pimeloyl-ACP methyl ester carboxylesterase